MVSYFVPLQYSFNVQARRKPKWARYMSSFSAPFSIPRFTLFWFPRSGFRLALGFSDKALVADFMAPCSAPTDPGEAQADPFPATHRLDGGFMLAVREGSPLSSRRANYMAHSFVQS